jgi:hypothetical protein
VLSCSTGVWAPDQPGAHFYYSPQSFTYQWSRGGTDVPGATQSTLKADPAGGDYRCRVTGHNSAGSAALTSEAHRVAPSPHIGLTLKLTSAKIGAGGPLPIMVANSSDPNLTLTGSLSGRSKIAAKGGSKRLIKLSAKSFTVAASASSVVKLRLPKALRLQLARHHKLSINLTATFSASGERQPDVSQTVAPRLLVKKGAAR